MENTMEENLENDKNLMNRSNDSVDKAQVTPDVSNKLIDSDSDGDEIVFSKKSSKKINQFDSDDDSNAAQEQTVDSKVSNVCNTEENVEIKKAHKRLTIVDSDSDNNEITSPTPHNKSFDNHPKKEAPVYDFNAKGEAVVESVVDEHIKKRLTVLCDLESSADEQESPSPPSRKSTHQKFNHKSGVKKQKEDKPKLMTAKDALEQRKEIRSESQRMTREMNVSLPYHKPKSRTLQEFLQKRPRFAAAIPTSTVNTPPSLALKMSTKDLEIVSQNLSIREKQVEEFFKSESESEEETSPVSEQAEKTVSELNNDNQETQPEKDQESISKEKQELINTPGNEMSVKDAEDTAMEEDQDQVVTTDGAVNEEKQSDGSENNTKSVVILQNVLLNPRSQDFDSGILEDLPNTAETYSSTAKTCSTTLESKDGATVQPSLEKSELDLLRDKYDVGKSADSGNYVEELNIPKVPSVLELLKEKVGDSKPQLSETSDGFIVFDETVNKLQERFMKHTMKKQHPKHKVELDVVSFTNGEIHTEKLAVSVKDDEIPILEKPGERMKQLKSDLETQMAERRSKYWQQRLNDEKNADGADDTNKGKDDCGSDTENDILDMEDEDEFTEIEDDEDEDILEENADEEDGDAKTKCAFGDDEAVESDEDDKGENMDVDDDDEAQGIVEEEESSMDADDEDEQLTDATKRKKKLKRIVRAFENDSDDDTPVTPVLENKIVNRTKSTDLLFDTTDTLDDLSGPTPHQRQDQRTPTKRTTTMTRSDLGFLTPVIQLTGLQSLNSGSKFLHDSPVSPFRMPQSSPQMTQCGPQKKLFADSQTLDEDIEDLCSGKFTTQPESFSSNSPSSTKKGSATLFKTAESPEAEKSQTTNTQEFLEVCSGNFTGITQPEKNETNPQKDTENNSEGKKESLLLGGGYFSTNSKPEEIKTLNDDDDGKLISQLLDEEEMERFKKRFESPEKSSMVRLEEEEMAKVGRVIFDSSSDDEEEEEIGTNKKKRRKNLISDDEVDDGDNNKLVDDNEEAQEEFDDGAVREVEYDSEENEIEVGESTIPNKKLKASDFFEDEAELSESEWGSADEDEKDLDEFEIEVADAENIDEEQMKRDLERIHMRRMLDDDTHEVKILQELLLDDGELHGAGRERQFKWKNIDSVGNEENVNKDDDGVYLDDENEDEEKWRKMRHEREAFLKKQQEKSQMMEDDDSIIDTNSQIFKLGQAAIKRSLSNTPNNTVQQSHPKSPEIKTSFTLMSKKGSFLTRSEHVLQRVAEFTSKTVNMTIGGPKNSKNFVFQSVDSESKVTVKDLKRKAVDGTPVALKKLRLDTISPAVQKKTQSKTDRSKKLFSSW